MLQVKQKNMCSCTYNVIYIDFNKSYFDSQLNSCPLVSLCHGHTVYKIQTLTSEVYKVANKVFPKLLKGFKQG